MDKGDLFPWDASGNEFFADVIVHGEPGFFLNAVFLCKVLQGSDLRTVEVACRGFAALLEPVFFGVERSQKTSWVSLFS